ncbi:YceI family protein [Sodalis sp. RH19]|uniref:YceI family protein n=1 Tax=Sodalis sp. RH19 TaxID=3394334 RepID=UPI0039B60990
MPRFLSLLPLLLVCAAAAAAPLHYDINTVPTAVVLSWKVLGAGNSHADITGITGRLDLNPRQDGNARVEVTIPVGNIDAHNGILSAELKSPLFFDQARYPNATFTSSRVVADGKDQYKVFGTLQIKTISHPVILAAKLVSLNDPRSGERHLTFYADTAIARSAFAMTRFIPMVSDRIAIHIMVTLPDPSVPSGTPASSLAVVSCHPFPVCPGQAGR